MSRPETTADLSASALRGQEFASFDLNNLPPTSALIAAVATFVKAAEASHLTVVNERYSRMQIFATPTPSELQDALASAQERWDTRRREYDAVLAVGYAPEKSWEADQIAAWSKENGMPLPWSDEAINA